MFITKIKKLFVKNNFFIICCIFFFLIFFKSFISSNGYLMPDSEWYLIAANNILDLKFLFFDELEIYGVEISKYKDHGRFLSAWPPLYALSISLVSFFINIDVYLASKLLNFFCLLVIFFILKKYISSNFVIFFIFCNATFLEIYFYTLSEYLFITLMMILAHNLNIYLTKENNFNLLVIFIILNLLFFTKLVGLFANLAIVFLFLYFFLIEKKIYFKLICVCSFALIIPFIYLLINHHLTGFYTGYPRGFRDSYDDQLFYLFKAICIEMNYLISSTVNNFNIDKNNWNAKYVVFAITFILQIFPLIFIKNKKIKLNFSLNKFFNNKMNIIVTFFIIFYIFPVYSLLLLTNVDPIYFRTISPMSFLLFFLIFINIKKITNFFINYMVYLISISFFINLLIPLIHFNFLTH